MWRTSDRDRRLVDEAEGDFEGLGNRPYRLPLEVEMDGSSL